MSSPSSAGSVFRRLGGLAPAKTLIWLGSLIIVFAVGLTLSAGYRRYNLELADAARELRTLDLLLATEAERSLGGVRLVLDSVADQVATDGITTPAAFAERYASRAVHDALQARVAGLPQLGAITLVDATGRLVNATRGWPIPEVSYADRPYFQHLRDDRTSVPDLSEPAVSRVSGTPTIYLARRISAPDGTFLGLVLGAIELRYFEQFYASLRLDSSSLIALWRRDGVLLARFPSAQIGQHVPAAAIVPPQSPWHGVPGVFEADWTIDGPPERRVIAAQPVEGFPVQVNIGRTKIAILQDWWREFFGIGSAVVLAVICLGLLIWALLRRFHAYEAVAASSREREKAILAQREAEDALRQAQKMEAVGQLTGGVAHDFNNLLTVVQSSLDLLRRPNLPEERRMRYVDAIEDATSRAGKLTGQLLAFARRQSLSPQVFDANDNIVAVGDLIDRLTGSRVTVDIATAAVPCLIEADPNQFDTSIVNLAVNARDAMEKGGRLTLAVKAVDNVPPTQEHAALAGPFVAVSVGDTGAGIPPDLLGRVFEPFFTTKLPGQGTGLGLSQVFGFAKQSGGDITVDSVPGRGTTVTLYLPRVLGEKPARIVEPEAMDRDDGTERSILVVEDNEQVARAAIQTLTELGYHTQWTPSAETAMEEIETTGGGFDLVFSDVMMQGMNGLELGQWIRARHPHLPVVLTSGYSEVVAQQGSAGFPLLQKPYSRDELVRALRRSLADARRSTDAGLRARV